MQRGFYMCTYGVYEGRDSSVGIATRYGLDGPGIESRWRRDFPHPSRPALGAYPASCKMCTGSFPGVKRPGRGADHPPPSKCQGHEGVELYLYSPSGPSWPVMGRTFTFTFTYGVYRLVGVRLLLHSLFVMDYANWVRQISCFIIIIFVLFLC